jgi:hypothetical protein
MTTDAPELTVKERKAVTRLTDRAAVLRVLGEEHRKEAEGQRNPRLRLNTLGLALEFDKRATELEWAAKVIRYPESY